MEKENMEKRSSWRCSGQQLARLGVEIVVKSGVVMQHGVVKSGVVKSGVVCGCSVGGGGCRLTERSSHAGAVAVIMQMIMQTNNEAL